MKCEEVHSDLGAFVLGGLEPKEATEVRRHLALCPHCQDELKELEKVNRALRAAPPPADPPPSYLKDEIISRVRSEEELSSLNEELSSSATTNEEQASASRNLRSKKRRRLGFVLPGLAAAAVVAIVALGVLFGWRTQQSPVATTTVQLAPTEQNEEYWGLAELHPQPSGNQQVELKLNNLDQPGPEGFYEAWFVSGEKYISAGSFTSTSPGQTDVWLTAPPQVRNYSTLLITEQTTTDDAAPTTTTVGKKAVLRGEVA
jgi:hypothetical protein